MMSFSFLMDSQLDVHKSINELYTVFLMYPEQMDKRMAEIRKILEDINTAENDAYDKLQEFIESIDKKGN